MKPTSCDACWNRLRCPAYFRLSIAASLNNGYMRSEEVEEALRSLEGRVREALRELPSLVNVEDLWRKLPHLCEVV